MAPLMCWEQLSTLISQFQSAALETSDMSFKREEGKSGRGAPPLSDGGNYEEVPGSCPLSGGIRSSPLVTWEERGRSQYLIPEI